jgi:hypothetical protein
MSQPARHEIEKFANDRFDVVRDDILAQHEEKRKQVLREVRRTHNSGGYLPALVALGAERVRNMILARADATVESFELHRVPSDARAETDLKRTAQEIAAGTISAIRGELDLLAKRTRTPRRHTGGHLNQEIEAAMKAALKEGVLRLSQQRITSMNSQRSSQLRVPARQNDSKTPPDKNRFDKTQQQRLDDASREMNETFYAYEQMRGLLIDPEYTHVGPPPSNAPTMLEEVSTLERDLRKIAIKTIRVYAEASWALASAEAFRTQLQSDAHAVLKWILATVNRRMGKEDISLLKRDAIEQAVQQEVENQIQKAEREWEASPPWTVNQQVMTPRASTGGIDRERSLDEGERQSSGSNKDDRAAAEGHADSGTEDDTFPLSKRVVRSAGNAQAIAERAARRQAIVNPILQQKRWKRGRLVTEAGVGKNSVYRYLDGTRAKITDENRKAIAGALGLQPDQLPD